jgi:hypothetical protein
VESIRCEQDPIFGNNNPSVWYGTHYNNQQYDTTIDVRGQIFDAGSLQVFASPLVSAFR